MAGAEFFRGYVRINLDALIFDHKLGRTEHRSKSAKNVARLVKLFRKVGCKNELDKHSVTGTIVNGELQDALEEARIEQLPSTIDGTSDPPLLNLSKVNCLHGLHRILAAKQVLKGKNRWWTVRLYGSDLPQNVAKGIVESFSYEQRESDGEIFRKILLNKNNPSRKQEWCTRLSESKQKDLKQLLNNPAFANAFGALCDIPGLWNPLELGTLHRLLTMHCDEEIICGINWVESVWNKEILASDSVQLQEYFRENVDAETAELLEGLAPAASEDDLDTVQSLMHSGKLFPRIHDESRRRLLLDQISRINCMIPTLHSIFEGIKQLEPACDVLKRLIGTGSKKTIKMTLMDSYTPTLDPSVEQGEGFYITHNWNSEASKKEFLYIQIWVFCLRNFRYLTPFTPRKERGKPKPAIQQPNPALEQRLGDLVIRSGFSTEIAHIWRSRNASKSLAKHFQDDIEIGLGHVNNGMVDDLALLIARARIDRTVSLTPQFFDCHLFDRERRNGRPFDDDYEADRKTFFLLPLLSKDVTSRSKPYITSSFARRDLLFCFFLSAQENPNLLLPADTQFPPDSPDGGNEPDYFSANSDIQPQRLPSIDIDSEFHRFSPGAPESVRSPGGGSESDYFSTAGAVNELHSNQLPSTHGDLGGRGSPNGDSWIDYFTGGANSEMQNQISSLTRALQEEKSRFAIELTRVEEALEKERQCTLSLNNRVSHLTQALQEERNHSATLSSTTVELARRQEALEKEQQRSTSLNNEIANLKHALQEGLARGQEALEKEQQRSTSLSDEVANLKHSLQQEESRSVTLDNTTADFTRLQKDLEKEQQRSTSLSAEVANLKHSLQQEESRSVTLDSATADLTRLQKDLEKEQKRSTSLNNEIATLTQDLQAEKSRSDALGKDQIELEDLRSKISVLEERKSGIEKLENERKFLRNEREASLKKEIEKLGADKKELAQLLRNQEKQSIEALTEKLSQEQKLTKALTQALEDQQKRFSKTQQDLTSQITELEGKLGKGEEAADHKEQIDKLTVDLAEHVKSAQLLRDQEKELTEKLSREQESAKASAEQLSQQQDSTKALLEEISQGKEQIKNLSGRLSKEKESIRTLQEETKKDTKRLYTHCNNLVRIIEKLRARNYHESQRLSNDATKIGLQVLNHELTKSVETLEKQVKTLRQENDERKVESERYIQSFCESISSIIESQQTVEKPFPIDSKWFYIHLILADNSVFTVHFERAKLDGILFKIVDEIEKNNTAADKISIWNERWQKLVSLERNYIIQASEQNRSYWVGKVAPRWAAGDRGKRQRLEDDVKESLFRKEGSEQSPTRPKAALKRRSGASTQPEASSTQRDASSTLGEDSDLMDIIT